MAESSKWILDRLAPVLREQDGFFTAGQARLLGITSARIDRLLDDERVRRVRPRVYVITQHAPIPRVDERVYSAWLAFDDKRLPWDRRQPLVAVSHETAALLLGIGTLPDDDEVQLTTTSGAGRTRLSGIRLHRSDLDIDDWRWERDHHVIVTTPARTVVDLVIAGHEPDHLTRMASDAMQLPGVSPRALAEALDRHPRGSLGRIGWFRRWLDDQDVRA